MNEILADVPRKSRCRHTAAKIKASRKGSAGPIVWHCPECLESWKSDPLDRYYTGHELAEKMVDWALVSFPTDGSQVLEPSAGDGAIVRALLARAMRVHAIEIEPRAARELNLLAPLEKLTIDQCDFVRWKGHDGPRFQLAVMNPPYSHPDGADGLHVAHALRHAERVVALVRANFLHGFKRWHQVFRWARLSRQVILSRRPPFYGPADAGHTARHDYQIIELIRHGRENLVETPQAVEVEFWL